MVVKKFYTGCLSATDLPK